MKWLIGAVLIGAVVIAAMVSLRRKEAFADVKDPKVYLIMIGVVGGVFLLPLVIGLIYRSRGPKDSPYTAHNPHAPGDIFSIYMKPTSTRRRSPSPKHKYEQFDDNPRSGSHTPRSRSRSA
jgi:hypothetical protein